jgi:hypothetical protein
MKRTIITFAAVACAASCTAPPSTLETDYLRDKASATRALQEDAARVFADPATAQRSNAPPHPKVAALFARDDSICKAFEPRARAIIGDFHAAGFDQHGKYNVTTILAGFENTAMLDGILYASVDSSAYTRHNGGPFRRMARRALTDRQHGGARSNDHAGERRHMGRHIRC